MPNCKDCGKLLQEDFNVCPYCGFPTDKILETLGEFPLASSEEMAKELESLAASSEQLTRGLETPEEEKANREKNPELAQPLPDAGGKEFGGPKAGPIQKQEEAYQEEKARKKAKTSNGEKQEIKALLSGRNSVLILLSVVVCVCIAIIIFFSNIMAPDAQMELGNDYLAAGQLEKAEKAFTNVLKQEKNNVEALTLLVEIKTALNNNYSENLEIIRLLDRVEKLTTDPAEIKRLDYQRIQLYTELGAKDKAEKLLQKYIELPVFTLESGSYPQDTLFEITSQSGTIYYMLDKEKTPVKYTGPIMLKPGSRQIKAWVEDENGLSGEKAEAFYFITAKGNMNTSQVETAETFLNSTLYKDVLPEFTAPSSYLFDQMADNIFIGIGKKRGDNFDFQALLLDLGVPQAVAQANSEGVVTGPELDDEVKSWFGDDFQVNHRQAGKWSYDKQYDYFWTKAFSWGTDPQAYVLSVQEDTSEEGQPLLTVQTVFSGFMPGPGVYHPVTWEKVLDTPDELPEASDPAIRELVLSNPELFQTAAVTLGVAEDGDLYYISCQYTN